MTSWRLQREYESEEERISATLCGSKTYTARYEHRCADCGGPIPKGMRYWREFWLIDGDPTTLKRHVGAPNCLEFD